MNPVVAKYFRPGEDINRQGYFDVAIEVLEAYREYLRAEEPYAQSTISMMDEVALSLVSWAESDEKS